MSTTVSKLSSSKPSPWLLASAVLVALGSAVWPPLVVLGGLLLSPLVLAVYYTLAVVVIQLLRDLRWLCFGQTQKYEVIGPGQVRYADPALCEGDRYPDDYDESLPNPNTHSTSKAYEVQLHAATFREDLMRQGLTYADLSNLPHLTALLDRVQANGGSFDCDATHDAIQQSFQYGTIHLPQKGASLLLLWVPRYGIMAWSVPPLGNNYPHSHCDADLHGNPMYGLTRGLSPILFHRLSPLQLVNIWFPAQPVPCKPLVVMDTASLDARNVYKHRLYNKRGTVEAFTHTFDANQRWVVPSEWRAATAVVFRTARAPHTSSPLPGEHLTAPLYNELKRICDCIGKALQEKKELDASSWELKVPKKSLEVGEGEAKLLEKVPILAKSLHELRETLQELPNRLQEAQKDPEQLQALAKDLDAVLHRSVAMRVAVRAVVLRWDVTAVLTALLAFLGTAWMFRGVLVT